MTVAPLIWLLIFDAIVCGIYWLATSVFGVTAPPRLLQVMIGLVILINVVIVVVWLLDLTGIGSMNFLQGPYRR